MTTTSNECCVSHEDHQTGIEDMKIRHHQFYQTLCNCITKEDKDD